MLCIAGLWRAGASGKPDDFTMLTTSPGSDMIPFHERQICVLPPNDWAAWIYLTKPANDLLRPLPSARLTLADRRTTASRIEWNIT